MADETLYVEKSVLGLLSQVDQWNRKTGQTCASFTNFFENAPVYIFEECSGYPEKIHDKQFRKNWDRACAFMIEHNVLENSGWPDHNGSLLYADRLGKLLPRTKAKPEHQEPAEPVKALTANPESYDKLFWMKSVARFVAEYPNLTRWSDLKGWFPGHCAVISMLGANYAKDEYSMLAWAAAYDRMVVAGVVQPRSEFYIIDPVRLKVLIDYYEEQSTVKMGAVCGGIEDAPPVVSATSVAAPEQTLAPDEGRKLEARATELRTQLNDLFQRSISSGPLPHKVIIHIVELMLGEYGASEKFATTAGGLFAEAQKIGRNPIRYAAWLRCSELLSKARAAVKGLAPEIDGCTIDEYESAIRNLTKGDGK